MRNWVIVLAVLAAVPACADTRFHVRQMTRDDVPLGKGQCDIRLQVDNEVEVVVRRDMVNIRTLAGLDARDDGSECNSPLPDRAVRGFDFSVKDSRNEIRLVEPPSPRNDFAAIVHIRDSAGGFGRYHFRLSWETGPAGGAERRFDQPDRRGPEERRGPEGFAWNNVINFRGRGEGVARFNQRAGQRLLDADVNVDRGGKIVVSFRTERGQPMLFTGNVIGRDGPRLRADMLSDDRRLHGIMMLSVDDRQFVNSITMDATDGRDRMSVTWDRR